MPARIYPDHYYVLPKYWLGEYGRDLVEWWTEATAGVPQFPGVKLHNKLEEILLRWAHFKSINYAVAFLTAEGMDMDEVEKMIGTKDNPGPILEIYYDLLSSGLNKLEKRQEKTEFIFNYIWRELVEGYESKCFRITDVLETKKGNCLGLSAFTAMFLQFAGIPVKWIESPGHIFLGVEGTGNKPRPPRLSDYSRTFMPDIDYSETLIIETTNNRGSRMYSGNLSVTEKDGVIDIGLASPQGASIGSYYNSLALELPLGSFERYNQLKKVELLMQHGPKFSYWFNYGQAAAEYGASIGDIELVREGLRYVNPDSAPSEAKGWVENRLPYLKSLLS